jgi:ammonia channel protein AmtB
MTYTDPFARIGFTTRRRPQGLLAPVIWLAGAIAGLIAMTVGAVLAVVTAAALAVIAVIAGCLVFFAGLALRARVASARRQRRDDDVIEAHKVDGAWVAYGWERQGR